MSALGEWWRRLRHPTAEERAWRDYHRKCREIDRFNRGPGGYRGGPIPPSGVAPVPLRFRQEKR